MVGFNEAAKEADSQGERGFSVKENRVDPSNYADARLMATPQGAGLSTDSLEAARQPA
jgi:hypothetical protein